MKRLLCLATANVLSLGCQAPIDIFIFMSLVGVMFGFAVSYAAACAPEAMSVMGASLLLVSFVDPWFLCACSMPDSTLAGSSV